GNLHPTEGYLLCPTLPGLSGGVYHYLSRDHSLERRAAVDDERWSEAWKYGMRAWRYCQHDCGHVIAAVIERGWGRIINIPSIIGSKGGFGQTNYAAAQAGMHGYTKSLALEVARKGVTVNTISPGYLVTKMVMAIPQEILESKILPQIPAGRLGKPEEIAALVCYLCSDDAGFVTGSNIAINGGQHMH
ncbi:SDR family oxidoreductase, partial [Paraburkholderia madseniana]